MTVPAGDPRWSLDPRQSLLVAPQSGQAIAVSRGELVRVEDVEGHQVGDMWAADAADPNGRDNFLAAVAGAGISAPAVPGPVNLFQNSVPQPDGSLQVGVAASRAGDAVSFLALRDIVFVLTACSVDYWPLNNGRCTSLRIQVLAAQ